MAATRVRGSVESGDYVAVGMLDGACWIAGLMKDLDGLSVGLLGGWLEHVNPISASVPLLCHAVLCRPPPPSNGPKPLYRVCRAVLLLCRAVPKPLPDHAIPCCAMLQAAVPCCAVPCRAGRSRSTLRWTCGGFRFQDPAAHSDSRIQGRGIS